MSIRRGRLRRARLGKRWRGGRRNRSRLLEAEWRGGESWFMGMLWQEDEGCISVYNLGMCCRYHVNGVNA